MRRHTRSRKCRIRTRASDASAKESFEAQRTDVFRIASRIHSNVAEQHDRTSQKLGNFLVISMVRTSAAILFMAVAIVLFLPWLILWTAVTNNADLMYSLSMTSVRIIARIVGI